MSAGEWRLPRIRPQKYRSSANSTLDPRARAISHRDIVAAVCYRLVGSEIEFLLVQTRRRRWTFPKGGVDAGMTRAQAAAIEALEEAGACGRIEESWFARYSHRKGGDAGSMSPEIVHAHLCEVLRQGLPDERDRNPTWFPADRAKRRLREDRSDDAGDELARVVDRAVVRIRRLHGPAATIAEPLRQVRFETRTTTRAGDKFQNF